MPTQAEAVPPEQLSSSHSRPIWFASSSFLPRPIMNTPTPEANFSRLSRRQLSCSATSLYLTMGPAMSWGNMDT